MTPDLADFLPPPRPGDQPIRSAILLGAMTVAVIDRQFRQATVNAVVQEHAGAVAHALDAGD